MQVLVGDIGGTKTVLALARVESGRVTLERSERYESASSDDLLSLVKRFCEGTVSEELLAVFGVAGPVENNICHATNLPWVIDGDRIARAQKLRAVRLINDLEAAALGVPSLSPEAIVAVQHAVRDPRAPCAVLGAGTGLGEAVLLPVGDGWCALAGEGGHADFGPRDAREDALVRWLRARYGHVSVERVVSGSALPDVYAFLKSIGRVESSRVAEELALGGDPGAVIGAHALARDDSLCEETVEIFLGALGAEAANFGLRVLARGGVFLTGGIAPRFVEEISRSAGAFMRGFRDKGRMSGLVESLPVWVVTDADLVLYGAAMTAVRLGSELEHRA